MQSAAKRKTGDSGRLRRELKTFWPKSHPVMFPNLQTDHWSRMKTMVPNYLTYHPAALLKDAVCEKHENKPALNSKVCLLPPLTETAVNDPVPFNMQAIRTPKAVIAPQNLPQYRNVFHDRARRNFCYWLSEKKSSTSKGSPLGAHKTFLGLPKV